MSLRIAGPKAMRALSFKNFYNEVYLKNMWSLEKRLILRL